jgi:hypothetical protein
MYPAKLRFMGVSLGVLVAGAAVYSAVPLRANNSSLRSLGGLTGGFCAVLAQCKPVGNYCVNNAQWIEQCKAVVYDDTCQISDTGGTSPCGSDSACNSQTGGQYTTACSS